MIFEYTIEKDIDIKSFLLENNFSLNIINKLLLCRDSIFINGTHYVKNFNLRCGDKLKVVLSEEKSNVKPIGKNIDIVYEDELFLAVDKPKGLVTIPSRAHADDSLAGRVAYYYEKNKIESGIHVINRLDIGTSGIVVFAKSKYIHQLTAKGKIEKRYLCLVDGEIKNESGVIDKGINREKEESIKRVVSGNGKRAITKYKVIKRENGRTLLDIELLTGRTHQIRVHMSYIGYPLTGDVIYNDNYNDGEYYLCAYKIAFYCPYNNKNYCFEVKK